MIEAVDQARELTGVIELLNRSGQVIHRIPCGGETVRIGRSYDNDLILSDPYVCAHHLEITFESGAPLLSDLDSVNGTYAGNHKHRIQTIHLSDGDLVQFGHSQLRYRKAGADVAPTLRDTARHGLLAWLGNPVLLVLAVLLGILSLGADDLLDNPERVRLLTLATELLYPFMAVLLWAGFWSLLNRIISHRANFSVHLTISFLGVAALFGVSQVISLAGFAFGAHESVSWFSLLGRIGVLSAVIYAHLRYTAHGTARRQFVLALTAGLVLFGTPAIGRVIDQYEFSSLPYLDPLLRPPSFRLVDGKPVESFFEQADALRQDVDDAVAE